jgi:pyruvate formate lyase activating enzyme
MVDGRILHLQRLSTEDGPGIRTTVFFKGCPLACAWCHNPESIARQMEVQWLSVRCLGCGTCVEVCPEGCLKLSEDGLMRDRKLCKTCGTCVEVCPAGAQEALGRSVMAEELIAELLKDRAYYQTSDGGVTLSGGEPTFQPEFAEALLRGLKAEGIATALDTCGLTSTTVLERLLPHTDLVLFDLKLFDEAEHHNFTGQPNARILDNLLFVRDYLRERPRKTELWIRTPLIPGATDSDENLGAIGAFLCEHLGGLVSRWELCAFNNLCRDQYIRLGLEWDYADTPLMTADELFRCEQTARNASCYPETVIATGATRIVETA